MQTDCRGSNHFSTCGSMEDVGDGLSETSFAKLGRLVSLAGDARLKHFRLADEGGEGAKRVGGLRLGVTLQQRQE